MELPDKPLALKGLKISTMLAPATCHKLKSLITNPILNFIMFNYLILLRQRQWMRITTGKYSTLVSNSETRVHELLTCFNDQLPLTYSNTIEHRDCLTLLFCKLNLSCLQREILPVGTTGYVSATNTSPPGLGNLILTRFKRQAVLWPLSDYPDEESITLTLTLGLKSHMLCWLRIMFTFFRPDLPLFLCTSGMQKVATGEDCLR